MICCPCFLLPVLLAIYLKFIQPLIWRFVPEAWRARIDAWLYPLCPMNYMNQNPAPIEKSTAEISPSNTMPKSCGCDDKKQQ
uniref:Uncharacterized protein n=1 Tax=Acrobeloides nanus TaxID=290746 RepID=A0A914DAY3_9BILA